MKKKVCRNCRLFVDGEICPVCKGNQFANSWQGRVNIISPENSMIAKKMNVTQEGEYVIKVR